MKKIKILQVIGGLNRCGAETMLMNLYRRIDRTKFQFDFLIYVSDDQIADYEPEIRQNNDLIIKLQLKRVKNPVLFYHDLNKVMKEGNYDCVHAHTLFNSGVVMYAAYKNKIPVRVAHSHSSGYIKKSTLINRTYVNVAKFLIAKYSTDKIACDVNSGKYLFGDQFKGPVLKNGIDLKKFCFHSSEKENVYMALREEHTLNLAVIGTFYEVKNHRFLLPIAKKLKENGLCFKLYFAGRGPLQQMLENAVKEYQLEENVIFLGVVHKMEDFLEQMDIVLMPSLYEGIPVSLIEAQAAGVQSIISENISQDVDMELGLVHYLSIEQEDIWTEKIQELSIRKKECVSAERIYERLTCNGYNVEQNLDFICNIYSGDKMNNHTF